MTLSYLNHIDEVETINSDNFMSSCSKSYQGTVVKDEEADEPDAKRVKVDTAADSVTAIPSPKPESTSTDIKVPIQKPLSTAKLSTETSSSDSKNLKQRPYSYTSSLNVPMANRYKLDNRTTTIKVVPPLPAGLADVCLLSFVLLSECVKLLHFLN